MRTPSGPSSGDAHVRGARLPAPAFILSGAALAAAGLWIARTPIAESWARGALADRGVPLDLKITRLDFGRVDVEELRLGSEKDPALTVQKARIRLNWRAPWKVEIGEALIEKPRLSLRVDGQKLDLKGLERLFEGDGSDKGGGLVIRKFEAKDAELAIDTQFGIVSATGQMAGDLATKNITLNFALNPGRLRGPGLDGRLAGGRIDARMIGERVTFSADARAERIMSALGDAAELHIEAGGGAAGVGGDLADLHGALDLRVAAKSVKSFGETADSATLFARLDKGGGPVDRASWRADLYELGGDWVVAPRAELAGGFSGKLPVGAALEGRGGWSFVVAESALGARAQHDLHDLLAPEKWPDPLKSPFAATAAALSRAGQNFAFSSSGDIDANAGLVTARLIRADSAARSGAQLTIEGPPNGVAFALSARGASASGKITLAGGGTPPLTLEVANLASNADGMKASGALKLARWKGGDSIVALDAAQLELVTNKGAGGLSFNLTSDYTGPIGGGRIDDFKLRLPGAVQWATDSWRVSARECPKIAVRSWAGAGMITGAFSGAPCAAQGVLVAANKGALSGRSDWAKLSIPARAGDKDGAPRLALSVDSAAIMMEGTTAAPRVRLNLPAAHLDVTNRDLEKNKDVVTALLAEKVDVALAPAEAGLGLEAAIAGLSADLDGTTMGLVDGGLNLKGVMAEGGLNADITNVTGRITDPGAAPMVADLALAGQGGAIDGKIAIDLDATPIAGGPKLADIRITHNLENGAGRARAVTSELRFTAARQPQDIFPALQGLIADVRGGANGVAEARWGEAGFVTDGDITLDNVAFSTFSLGPVEGVKGTVRFDDLLKPSTAPGQTIEASLLNPGVLVENVSLKFQLLSPEEMQIEGGEAKVVGGRFLVEPVRWKFGPQRQEFALQVEEAPIENILALFNNPDFKGTGTLRGRIPLSLTNGKMRVEHARLEAAGDGVLQINIPAAAEASSSNKLAKLAFDALRDLQFTLLAVDVDGDVDGRLENKLTIRGRSPEASNLPFIYNIGISAQILPLIQQARYIYDKSAIGDYTRGQINGAGVSIDVEPAPKE